MTTRQLMHARLVAWQARADLQESSYVSMGCIRSAAHAPSHRQQGTSHVRRTTDKAPYKARRDPSMVSSICDGYIAADTDACTSCCSDGLANSPSRRDVGSREVDHMDEGDAAFV